jgi:transcriptional regulator with GAF, ATPase, and Fis domain
LIIPDCAEYFISASPPPIFQHSAASVIALPLPLNNEIFATLHLGYETRPDNLYKLASFATHLCPTIAACLGVVLSVEVMRHERILPEPGEMPPVPESAFDALVTFHSQAMRDVVRQLDALTNIDVPVLLLGETGTGKSMIARHIHDNSTRASARFVRVNCPSLASSLFESEMFGHAKGSFTGATKNRVGRFELAHKGTLFLDEVAELSLDMQSKLLQVLDDSSFERVGESTPIMVDMRIVAATNVHIGEAISLGKLRSDLFHRISVYTIELPPLRQRPEDIPPLARTLSAQSAQRLGLPDLLYSGPVLRALSEYYWPGNTRELSNLITRLVICQNVHNGLTQALVRENIRQSESFFLAEAGGNPAAPMLPAGAPLEAAPIVIEKSGDSPSLADMERRHIQKVLEQAGGVVSGPRGAAKMLGLPRSTLLHRMRKLGLTAKTVISDTSGNAPG